MDLPRGVAPHFAVAAHTLQDTQFQDRLFRAWMSMIFTLLWCKNIGLPWAGTHTPKPYSKAPKVSSILGERKMLARALPPTSSYSLLACFSLRLGKKSLSAKRRCTERNAKRNSRVSQVSSRSFPQSQQASKREWEFSLRRGKVPVFFHLRINLRSPTGGVDVDDVALRAERSSGCSPPLRCPLILPGAVRDAQAGEAFLPLARALPGTRPHHVERLKKSIWARTHKKMSLLGRPEKYPCRYSPGWGRVRGGESCLQPTAAGEAPAFKMEGCIPQPREASCRLLRETAKQRPAGLTPTHRHGTPAPRLTATEPAVILRACVSLLAC